MLYYRLSAQERKKEDNKDEYYPPPSLQEEPQPSPARLDSAGAATQAEKPSLFARLAGRTRTFFKLNIPLFFYLNFLCRSVHREKGKYILPYRGTRVKIAKTARINVRGRVSLNANRLFYFSKAESLVKLSDGAVWDVNGNFTLWYGGTLLVQDNAHLITGDRVAFNSGGYINCCKKITIGNYIGAARMVILHDSDRHPIYNSEGKRINEDREIIIEDHVWLGLKTTVLKGAHIKTGAVISANSLVSGIVPARTISVSNPARPVVKDIYWEF